MNQSEFFTAYLDLFHFSQFRAKVKIIMIPYNAIKLPVLSKVFK